MLHLSSPNKSSGCDERLTLTNGENKGEERELGGQREPEVRTVLVKSSIVSYFQFQTHKHSFYFLLCHSKEEIKENGRAG